MKPATIYSEPDFRASKYISRMPPELGALARYKWLSIANGKQTYWHEEFYGKKELTGWNGASRWIEDFYQPFRSIDLPFDINITDQDLCELAEKLAQKYQRRHYMNFDLHQHKILAEVANYGIYFDLEKITEKAIWARLSDAKNWRRQLRQYIGRQQEKLIRNELNLVHAKRDIYISKSSLKRRRRQLARNRALLAAMTMINELGQQFTLEELMETTISNPVNRRGELMTRIAGFEEIAVGLDHAGEFITITCPSAYHAVHHHNGKPNKKFNKTDPREAQNYLNTVWARIKAELDRKNIKHYGFRVVEPHHDGTPHWHGLLFMNKVDVQVFRETVAKHACREDRRELGLFYCQTKTEAYEKARAKQQSLVDIFKENGKKLPSIKSLLAGIKVEADFWQDAHYQVFQGVSARVDFKAINWNKGTAAGYIAKYIAKNIDGKKQNGESIGWDLETDDLENAVVTAELVNAWAALWGIRQFQQIGGPPVTVWREMRRLEVSEDDYHDVILCAAQAADKGDWAKFTQIMGGAVMKRKDRPVQLYKEDPVEINQYGEPKKPVIRGIVDITTGVFKISRTHEWVLGLKGGNAPAWTCVNNSTNSHKVAAKPLSMEEINQTLMSCEPIDLSIKPPKYSAQELQQIIEQAKVVAEAQKDIDDLQRLQQKMKKMFAPRVSLSEAHEMAKRGGPNIRHLANKAPKKRFTDLKPPPTVAELLKESKDLLSALDDSFAEITRNQLDEYDQYFSDSLAPDFI